MARFQLAGLHWLLTLQAKECGGILADESGLGKTVTVLAFLDVCAEYLEGSAGPYIALVNGEENVDRYCLRIAFRFEKCS